jgi:hypothetical protein
MKVTSTTFFSKVLKLAYKELEPSNSDLETGSLLEVPSPIV